MPLSEAERARVLRVVDADRNRAVEALRTVEEHARFVRRAPALALRLQALRRAVHAALDRPALARPWTARDAAGDPGRPQATTAAPEPARGGVLDVVAANLSRAKEALRALEEWGRLLDPEAAAALARLRHDLYALEPGALAARPALEARVCVLLGPGPGRPDLAAQARACLAGGVRLLQVRWKDAPARALAREVAAVVALAEAAGALVVVNDRPDVALCAGAHGVHVGQEDLAPEQARRVVGPGALVGASTHDAGELAAALAADVDYVGFGTLYGSPTKPALAAQGLEALRALAPGCPVPIYGIGGVTAATAADVLAAGAFGVAVAGAVLDAPDPTAAARALVEAVAGAAVEPVAGGGAGGGATGAAPRSATPGGGEA